MLSQANILAFHDTTIKELGVLLHHLFGTKKKKMVLRSVQTQLTRHNQNQFTQSNSIYKVLIFNCFSLRCKWTLSMPSTSAAFVRLFPTFFKINKI